MKYRNVYRWFYLVLNIVVYFENKEAIGIFLKHWFNIFESLFEYIGCRKLLNAEFGICCVYFMQNSLLVFLCIYTLLLNNGGSNNKYNFSHPITKPKELR